MNILILKLGATGDVVRTTTLLRRLDGAVTWITAEKNKTLLHGIDRDVRCFSWEDRAQATDRPYDLVINLEDETEVSSFLPAGRACRSARSPAAGLSRFCAFAPAAFAQFAPLALLRRLLSQHLPKTRRDARFAATDPYDWVPHLLRKW